MAGIHDGHRERLRQRFSEHGPDVFADHELLELLLTYAIPRRDTNETAHKLLQRFGSLAGVFAADAASLQTVDGIGPAAAQLLQLEAAIRRRIALSGVPHRNGKPLLNAPHRAARYAELLLSQETDERMYALCLNAQRALLCAVAVGSGSVSELTVYPRTIVELAILRHAHGIILAHNHPSGDPLPSQPDIETTEAIRAALDHDGVSVIICREPCPLHMRRLSKAKKPVFGIDGERCVNCHTCVDTFGCPAFQLRDGKVSIDPVQCIGCAVCAQVCPNNAIRPQK